MKSILQLARPVLDIHVKCPRETNFGRIHECAAITPDVFVVPVFWQSQLGERFICFWKGAKDLSAVETSVGRSVLINCDKANAEGNQDSGGRLEICGPVLHREGESIANTIALKGGFAHRPIGGMR